MDGFATYPMEGWKPCSKEKKTACWSSSSFANVDRPEPASNTSRFAGKSPPANLKTFKYAISNGKRRNAFSKLKRLSENRR